jgi:hypothetical protein
VNTTTETMPPAIRRVRAYFAPVNRSAQQPTIFDPAQQGTFELDAPPAPWIDLGWISGFARRSGTKTGAVFSGAPAVAQMQSRTEIDATVSFQFSSWGKLQMALAAGVQQLNLLKTQTGVAAAGSGGAAIAAVALQSGTAESTASVLQLGAPAAANYSVGEWVVVDVDYTGQTGFVGSGVSGAYVSTALTDVDYVRRVSLNVGRVSAIQNGALTLENALIAGVPSAAMKVSGVAGFCDREGSTFFQEWSALFVAEGQQGERVLWHYPRLQVMASVGETAAAASGGLESLRQSAEFRALPVQDPVDGQNVVCFRSFVAS